MDISLEKKYTLARKGIDRRWLLFVITVTAVGLLNWLIRKDKVNEDITPDKIGNLWIFVPSILAVFGFVFFLFSRRGYHQEGFLYFNPQQIRIEKDGVTEIIPVAEIQWITLKFSNISGDNPAGGFGFIAAIFTADGSGNKLIFRFNEVIYKLNPVLESTADLNAFRHLFKACKELYGTRTMISGAPQN